MSVDTMTKQELAIELLKALKGAGISYKDFANACNIKVKSLYSWIQNKNLSDERADYIINAVQHYFPDEYQIIMMNFKIQSILQGGDILFEEIPFSILLN